MALFANRQSQPQSDNLIEIPAGKCTLRATGDADEREVVGQAGRGVLYIRQSEDMLVHFCWKNRDTGHVHDDLIVFPGDTSFVKVTECPADLGRVYMLKFNGSEPDRWLLFWMQDADTSKDQARCDRVNQLLNLDTPSAAQNPVAAAGQSAGGAGRQQLNDQLANMQTLLGLPPGSATGMADLSQLGLGGINPSALFGAMAGAGGGGLGAAASSALTDTANTPAANVTPARAAGTQGQGAAGSLGANAPARAPKGGQQAGNMAVQLSDLQNLLSALPTSATTQQLPEPAAAVALDEVVSGANVSDTVANEVNAARLMPLLPTDASITQNQDELNATIRSPQYRQAARVFGEALQSGQLGPVMQQFGLPNDVVNAATAGDISRMAAALQSSETGTTSTTTGTASASDTGTTEGTTTTSATSASGTTGSGVSTSASESTTESGTNATSTPSAEREPEPKRSKAADTQPEDNMELD